MDELERHQRALEPAARELTSHVVSRLSESLERSGVRPISGEVAFDRLRHRAEDGRGEPGDPIANTLSPGFEHGGRVVRRALVRLEPPSGS